MMPPKSAHMADAPKKPLELEGVDAPEPAVTPLPAELEPAIEKKPVVPGASRKRDIPQGLWTKCPSCEEMVFDRELAENQKVCPHCEHHFPTTAMARIEALCEPGSFQETDADMASVDTLEFTGTAAYADKLEKHKEKTGLKGCGDYRHRPHGRPSRGTGSNGFQLPRRLHGFRSGRKNHPHNRGGNRSTAAGHYHLLQRWSTHV